MGSALRIATREKITVAFETKEATYGTGVFACQDIARGDTIWAFDDKMCTRLIAVHFSHMKPHFFRFTESSIKLVKDEDLAQLLYKGFMTPSSDKVIYIIQTSRFIVTAQQQPQPIQQTN